MAARSVRHDYVLRRRCSRRSGLSVPSVMVAFLYAVLFCAAGAECIVVQVAVFTRILFGLRDLCILSEMSTFSHSVFLAAAGVAVRNVLSASVFRAGRVSMCRLTAAHF